MQFIGIDAKIFLSRSCQFKGFLVGFCVDILKGHPGVPSFLYNRNDFKSQVNN